MENSDPISAGMDCGRLDRLVAAIENDVARELYDGAVIAIARRGRIALHKAIGYSDRARKRTAYLNDVFHIFSITKVLTAAAVLARIDRGELTLTTPVAEVIPEFGVKGKQRITIFNLLTHTGGMMAGLPALAPEMLGNLEAVVAAACRQTPDAIPGEDVIYSALAAHAVLAEVVRRIDGGNRSFSEILDDEILQPLGMKDTSLRLRKDLAARRVPIVVRDRSQGLFDPDALEFFNMFATETAEIPGGGAFSTAENLLRFAEMMRREGELDGIRVLSPAIVRMAVANHTGNKPNRLWLYAREMRGWNETPAFAGFSFFIRGNGIFTTHMGTLTSPSTFCSLGAGSTVLWVDPERDLSFVCLTAGLLEESHSADRFQRLSDLAVSAVLD